MLVLRTGCRVPFPEELFEEYMLMGNQIIANISADKIRTVMEHFICIHESIITTIRRKSRKTAAGQERGRFG